MLNTSSITLLLGDSHNQLANNPIKDMRVVRRRTEEQILEALGQGLYTPIMVAERLGREQCRINTIMKEMAERGDIEREYTKLRTDAGRVAHGYVYRLKGSKSGLVH